MSENRLKTIFDVTVSGAILVVAIAVGLIIWKVAQALGVNTGGNDEDTSGDPSTDFGEGSITSGEFFEGPIW